VGRELRGLNPCRKDSKGPARSIGLDCAALWLAGLASIQSVHTSSLDILEKTKLSPDQARAILRVMETELAAHPDGLATGIDLRVGMHALELKIESVRSDLVRWMFVCTFGQAALLAGVMYFVLTYVRK
jgi:hypothetical protein